MCVCATVWSGKSAHIFDLQNPVANVDKSFISYVCFPTENVHASLRCSTELNVATDHHESVWHCAASVMICKRKTNVWGNQDWSIWNGRAVFVLDALGILGEHKMIHRLLNRSLENLIFQRIVYFWLELINFNGSLENRLSAYFFSMVWRFRQSFVSNHPNRLHLVWEAYVWAANLLSQIISTAANIDWPRPHTCPHLRIQKSIIISSKISAVCPCHCIHTSSM